MASKFLRTFCSPAAAATAAAPKRKFKVSICGAAGGIGQPLSLLLKFNTMISDLSLYDVRNTEGVALDLSHIETMTKVRGYTGEENMSAALEGADIVMVAAGVPRTLSMTANDVFKANASVIQKLAQGIARTAPTALVGIITNPLNSMVPVACETLKKEQKFDANRVFGISTLDIVRANTFVADEKNMDPKDVYVPVIGGHSGDTMVPLLSKTTPNLTFTDEQIQSITNKVQQAAQDLASAKDGFGTATLSMAYSAGRFTNSLLRALNGAENIIEIAFIHSCSSENQYFCQPFLLGKNGIEKHLQMAKLTDYESDLLKSAASSLRVDVEKGVSFGAAVEKADKAEQPEANNNLVV